MNNRTAVSKKHYYDDMTPKERALALSFGESVDRMPIYMFADPLIPPLLRKTQEECESSAKGQAEMQIEGFRAFGYDSVGIGLGHSLAIALGGKYRTQKHSSPLLVEYPLKNMEDIDKLDLDMVSLKNDKIASRALDAIRYIQEAIGEEVTCSISLRAPLSAASGLINMNQFLRILTKNPEKTDVLLRFVSDALFKIAEEFLKEDIPVSLSDPIGSCNLISPKLYRTVALPYEQEFIKRCCTYMKEPPGLHICGDTTKCLEDIKQSGAVSFSVDNAVDLSVAKEKLGDTMFLSGNVPPVEVMLLGTPADIRKSVRDCYRKAWDSPKGFSICTGCECCYGTPSENIEMYISEARCCAKEQAEALRIPKEHYVWDE